MRNYQIVHATTGVTLNLFYQIKKSGRVFGATFVKKDGSIRTMNCKAIVYSALRGGKATYNAPSRGHMRVFSNNDEGYRTINLDKLISITFNRKLYIFNNL